MVKKFLSIVISATLLIFLTNVVHADTIDSVNFNPLLDISYFDDYAINAGISDYPSFGSVTLELSGINHDNPGEWLYYADGTLNSRSLSYDMSYISGTTWRKNTIRPDHIYPAIFFVPGSVSWTTAPLDINVRRNNYQLLHLNNPFTMTDDMNFWIEINATPVSTTNSSDLLVYLVRKSKLVNFFQTDWRNSADVELVGTLGKNDTFHHTHSGNSSHYLIRLTAKAGGLFGTKNIDINDDFWLVIYNNSPNTNRGWNLKYHPSTVCTNTNRWYRGNQTGWTTTTQSGCPDVHVHFARRDATYKDGIKAIVTAGSISRTENIFFNTLPNLAPNETNFINPLRGTHSGNMNVSWNAASDPNEDVITYNLFLLNSSGTVLKTLVSNTSATNFNWDTTSETNADYSLKGTVCDTSSLCTSFYSEPFTVDNTSPIRSLSAITMVSNNTDTSKALPGNKVTLSFTSSDTILSPTVNFFSGGGAVLDSTIVTNVSGNNWIATYIVNSSDQNGQITFIINGTNLAAEYTEVTSGSYVTKENPVPTPTPNTVSNIQENSSTNPSVQKEKCSGLPFTEIPDLFQINTTNNSATLYYSPTNSSTTNYYISYSDVEGQYQHGVFTGQGHSTGVLSYTIYYLKPNTVYYFRIRGQSGCVTGGFSPEIAVTTKGSKNFIKNFFNKNIQEVTASLIKDKKTIKTITPVINKKNSPVKKTSNSQKNSNCFLWWCF